jgi:hypothetical protein
VHSGQTIALDSGVVPMHNSCCGAMNMMVPGVEKTMCKGLSPKPAMPDHGLQMAGCNRLYLRQDSDSGWLGRS